MMLDEDKLTCYFQFPKVICKFIKDVLLAVHLYDPIFSPSPIATSFALSWSQLVQNHSLTLFFQKPFIFAPLLKKSTVFNKIYHLMRVWRNW